MTRLPYSTTGGQISESDTFVQILEYLRLAQEGMYTVSHLRRANDDQMTADLFLAAGEQLKKTQALLTTYISKRWN